AAGRVALVTIVSTRGSAPREPGARMIVRPDGSFTGTIGGGKLEYQIISETRMKLAAELPVWSLRHYALGPEFGQCCGGQVTVLIEVFETPDLGWIFQFEATEFAYGFRCEAYLKGQAYLPRRIRQSGIFYSALPVLRKEDMIIENFYCIPRFLILFGAGHVGRALVMALAALPFRVIWVDQRADAFPSLLPANVFSKVTDDYHGELARAPERSYVLVMTHSHSLDLGIITSALTMDKFDFVGLIGSETKRARFINRMKAANVSQDQIAKLVCPIGVPGIRGKQPAVIAASVAAQLLQVHEKQTEGTLGPIWARSSRPPAVVKRD
ncbi:MAG: xanthine dehydrogenase accessory protein XdhC, partial [Hyphomicrobiales bacterium]